MSPARSRPTRSMRRSRTRWGFDSGNQRQKGGPWPPFCYLIGWPRPCADTFSLRPPYSIGTVLRNTRGDAAQTLALNRQRSSPQRERQHAPDRQSGAPLQNEHRRDQVRPAARKARVGTRAAPDLPHHQAGQGGGDGVEREAGDGAVAELCVGLQKKQWYG